MKRSKTNEIKNYLQEHGHITAWEAIEKFHVTRLAVVISRLREKGWEIETVNRKADDGTTYALYVLNRVGGAEGGKQEKTM